MVDEDEDGEEDGGIVVGDRRKVEEIGRKV
jgi:hypothetical protein